MILRCGEQVLVHPADDRLVAVFHSRGQVSNVTGFEFDAVLLEQPPDRVVMTLLAGGDVAKDGHPPCLVEAPVHVAGESVPSSRLPG